MLQAVKAAIFKIPQEPREVVQLAWATQLSSALECYNVKVEEDDGDPKILVFQKLKGVAKFEDPQLRILTSLCH